MYKLSQLFKTKLLKESQPLRFPSGRDASEITCVFEAANRCIQLSRRQGQPIPLDPTLADFEILEDGENFELRLKPIATNRHYQSPNQDQPALARLLYEIITGQLLTRNDSERALNCLAGTDLSAPPLSYAYPRLVAVIRQALLNQFYSLDEMNGALGFALYQEVQNFARSQRASRNAASELLPDYAEEVQTENKRRSANIALLFSVIAVCLVALIGLAVLSTQKDTTSQPNQVAQAANALPTFTPNPADAGIPPNGFANNQISSSDGILHRQFNLSDPILQTIGISDLGFGEASLVSQPALAVTGASWNADENTVSLALNDGEYRVYDYTTSKVAGGQLYSDNGSTVATCWSPDGKYYINFTVDNQVIFHNLANNSDTKATINDIAYTLTSVVGSLNTDCASTVTWSPNNQAALVRSYAQTGSAATEKYWIISEKGLVQVENQSNFSAYFCGVFYNKPIWSPDSSQFAMLTIQNTNKSNLYFEVHGTNTGVLDYSAEINDSIIGCDANSNLLSDAVWLPDNSIARLTETPVGKFGIYSTTLAIFAVPRPREVVSSPFLTITDASRSNLGASYGIVTGLNFSQNNEKLALAYYPAETDVKNQYSPFDSQNAKRYLVLYRRVSNDVSSKWINWSNLTLDDNFYPRQVFLSWNSDGNEILGSDGLGDIGIWFGAATAPVSGTGAGVSKIAYSPLIKNVAKTNLGDNYYDWSPNGNFIMRSNAEGLQLLDAQTQQVKLQFSAEITVPSLPNFYFTVGIDDSTSQGKIKLGQWSPNSQYYAARVSTHLSNQPNGQTPSYLGVWKVTNESLDFLGLIQLGDIHINPDNNNWSFDSQKPIIYVVGLNGKKISFDLTEPIPAVDKQPNLTDTSNPDVKSTDFFTLSSESDVLDSVMAWSPQADTILNGTGTQLSIDSMESSKTFSLATNTSLNMATFSPDGKVLALGESNGDVQLVEIATRKIITDISATHGQITTLRFSPDGRWLVTGATDRQVKVWQVSQDSYWPLLQVLQGQTTAVAQVNFSPDSRYLLTNDTNNTTLIWRLR